jgi:hypothetical protein
VPEDEAVMKNVAKTGALKLINNSGNINSFLHILTLKIQNKKKSGMKSRTETLIREEK